MKTTIINDKNKKKKRNEMKASTRTCCCSYGKFHNNKPCCNLKELKKQFKVFEINEKKKDLFS